MKLYAVEATGLLKCYPPAEVWGSMDDLDIDAQDRRVMAWVNSQLGRVVALSVPDSDTDEVGEYALVQLQGSVDDMIAVIARLGPENVV